MSNRGGKRAGSGRKAGTKWSEIVAVRLTPAQVEKARRIGEGNISVGVRAALAEYEEWERWQDNRQETTP